MDKVAIYVRVSTADKQDYSRQVSDLEKLIFAEGYTSEQIDIYSEKLSGYDQSRPELNKMMEVVNKNPKEYNCIYVTEISRIGRNPKHTREIVDKLIDMKVPLYIQTIKQSTLDEKGDRNIIVSIILQVLMEFADLEAKTMKTRIKSGKRQRAKDGKFSTSNLPYGYTIDSNGYLILNNSEADTIRLIFDKYKQGFGAKVIAQTLNEMRIKTRYNISKPNRQVKFEGKEIGITGDQVKWSDTVILQMIKNTIYKGERRYKVEDAVYENINGKKVKISEAVYDYTESPIIIEPELFDYCNNLRKNKVDRQFYGKHIYLLKDLMYCGVCGKKYMGRYIPSKDKVYICTSKLKKGECCGNKSINISLIESVIFDQMIKSENLMNYLDNPDDLFKKTQSDISKIEQKIKNEEFEKNEKLKQLENLIKLITISKNPNFEHFSNLETELNDKIKLHQEKIVNLSNQLFSLKTIISNFDREYATKEMLLNVKNNRIQLGDFVKQFINKIIITVINDNYTLVDVFIILKGIELKNTLKLFVYSKGARTFGGQKGKLFKYLPILNLENNPIYRNNILIIDKSEINSELISILKHEDLKMDVNPYIPIVIPKEDWIIL